MWMYVQTVLGVRWEGTIDRAQFLKRANTENECDVDIFPEAAVE